MTIIAGHQPDLLPYSGFFYKMAKADLLDLKIYDQFVAKGYQRRVKMRESWTSVPIHGAPGGSYASIVEKRIDPDLATKTLANTITGRYRSARYWKARSEEIMGMVSGINTDRLWAFNLELILRIRDFLGISTPVAVGKPTDGSGPHGVVDGLLNYGNQVTYLSGTGARVYMGDCAEFTEAGIPVIWSKHQAVTGDSILSVIFDYENPLEIVLKEEPEESTT